MDFQGHLNSCPSAWLPFLPSKCYYLSLSWREQGWVHLSVSPAQLISLTDLGTGDSIHISSG